MHTTNATLLPLAGLNILDFTDGKAELCGRLLADLGADVILVEPREGNQARQQQPMMDGESLYFASHNANKRGLQLSPSDSEDMAHLHQLLANTDLLLHNNNVSLWHLGADTLQTLYPQLIIQAITDYGLSGPYKDFSATNATHLTLAGVVARSGIHGHEPLLPPGNMATEAAAIQAAWVALLAVIYRNRTGKADRLDFSIFEATAQLIDPGLGVTGSAAAGKTAAELAQKGRPRVSPFYPIFPCKDGYVRLCILNPRQWAGMSDWLGPDHPFTDKRFGKITERFNVIKEINKLIAALFSGTTGEELVEQGQARGIPMARVAAPANVFADNHFNARQAFCDWPIGTAQKTGKLASGYLHLDGQRTGVRTPAPRLDGENRTQFLQPHRQITPPTVAAKRPLEGIRVLDLGVIVAGAELGRLLSDQGAEVIKIENQAFPDGLRQSHDGSAITPSFAQGTRGKLSFGLNLRHPKGIEIFKQLATQSDVVLSNFKPGTMESLGLGYEVLSQINPRIIMADSSALGSTGPRAKSMGYGPLVRASTGLTGLWRYPQMADGGFSDGITIYPDHFAARVSATAILALLLRREQTGMGGTVSVSQAEVILNAMATEFLMESLNPGWMQPRGNADTFEAPNNLYPCDGIDQWCLIGVRHDQDWQQLCQLLDQPQLASRYSTREQRLAASAELDALVTAWTRGLPPEEVMQRCQAVGIPAARMLRIEELMNDPQLHDRQFFRQLVQPGIATPLATENSPVRARFMPEPEIRPAPFMAEHTQDLARRLLQLSDAEIESLTTEGVLEQQTDFA